MAGARDAPDGMVFYMFYLENVIHMFKMLGIKITLTLRRIIIRRPMSSKEVSKIGSRNMVITTISLTETNFWGMVITEHLRLLWHITTQL